MKKILATLIISSSLVFAMDNSIGLDTLVGATIGVAIGNQVGKGNGRDVARVAGGLLGAGIANSSRTPSYSNGYYDNNNYSRTTYVRTNYDDDYDRYYVYERRPAPPPVTIIYQNYDRYPSRYYYNDHHGHPRHHHRDWHGR
ncbi:MAG: glycine zipper 2TM domain-containing protein [Aliarcobacter sp.]|nr:glycine zipper 2TM domain-containing protein [Aliarcobacter sp.]